MLYFPWREETDLLSSDQTYTSKFYEPDVQAVIEQNRVVFEPDADAIADALEAMRNNEGNIVHSYDSINDQENSDLRDETRNVSDIKRRFFTKSRIFCEKRSKLSDQAFLKMLPRHLGFKNYSKFAKTNNIILLDFWLCHEAKHCQKYRKITW